MIELEGRALAELRNKEMKSMLLELEKRRDVLYDEVANRKGKIEILEDLITEVYGRILNVNKEVQQEEIKAAIRKKAQEEEAKRARTKEEKREVFEGAKRGIKTPKPERRKRTKKAKD